MVNTPLSLALNTQGVNLGFGDVASLASCVEDSLREGGRLGQREYLAQYETERQRHNLTTMMGVDGLQVILASYWSVFSP